MYETVDEANKYLIGVNYELNTTEITLMNEANLDANYYDGKEALEEAYNKGEIAGYIDYNV